MLKPELTNLSSPRLPAADAISAGNDFAKKTDFKIWQEFKLGSEIAFIHIYNKYFNVLYRYASQFCKDRNHIKDTIQDLFIELLRKREKLSNTSSIKFYLFKSLKTAIIHKIKREKIDYRHDMEGFNFDMTISVEDKIINAQIDDEKKQQIQLGLAKMKKKQREIIYYYYFEDLEINQIAALMNFSNTKSAQNLLYRSLGILKNHLQIIFVLLQFNFI